MYLHDNRVEYYPKPENIKQAKPLPNQPRGVMMIHYLNGGGDSRKNNKSERSLLGERSPGVDPDSPSYRKGCGSEG